MRFSCVPETVGIPQDSLSAWMTNMVRTHAHLSPAAFVLLCQETWPGTWTDLKTGCRAIRASGFVSCASILLIALGLVGGKVRIDNLGLTDRSKAQ